MNRIFREEKKNQLEIHNRICTETNKKNYV